MFDTLSKELYSLKQGLGENVAKFKVHLFQQVQILLVRVQGKDSAQTCGGGEAWLLLWWTSVPNTSKYWLIR